MTKDRRVIILIGLIILINGNITKIAEDGKTYIIMIMTGNSVLCAK